MSRIDGGKWLPVYRVFEEALIGLQHSVTFITFEGGEGSGKSSAIKGLSEYLAKWNVKHMVVNDPGGCEISNAIRTILLNKHNTHLARTTEMLLYQAARAQLFHEKILPLEKLKFFWNVQ